MPRQDTVLILQGGGALGSYQAGVYQTLLEHHTPIDWVIGTSIGAINSALIAGNPPEHRVSRLKEFWESLAVAPTSSIWPGLQSWGLEAWGLQSWMELPQSWMHFPHSANTLETLLKGINGFFAPRLNATWNIDAKVPVTQAGFYDTSPLKATLEKYVDFDYLNSGVMRISVCAVDLDTGQSAVFDSRKQKIRAEHIMASGALPPGFPPVEIDGRVYWDGGIYSNSPLEVFLEDNDQNDALCFMVDLWDPTEARPDSISKALARYKDIQYASRGNEQLKVHQRMQDLQRAIRILTKNLTPAAREKEELQKVIELGCDHTINVVHLIMKALPNDNYFKDIDFTTETTKKRWQVGIDDCRRALRHKSWLRPLPPHAGLIIHELPQE